MNYKEMMINQAKAQGRISLHPFAFGVIASILNNGNSNADEKLNNVFLVREGMYEAWDDRSLPWDVTDTKKAPLPEEAPQELCHSDCIINITKAQSLLEPWYVEQILEERRASK